MNTNNLKEKLSVLSINQRYIYEIIRRNDHITRKEISNLAGIKMSTTIKLVSKLIDDGLIKETKKEQIILGRKPNSLRLNPEIAYAVGIDIGRTKIRGAIINLNGETIQESECAIKGNSKEVIEIFMDMIGQLLSKTNKENILGIGIGVSGIIDYNSGSCLYTTGVSDFENIPIRNLVQSKYKIPVIVDDTARSHAVGEKFYGLAKDVKNFIYVSLGEGIGSGIFINDNLYRGQNGISGEIGHIVINRNGPLCRCGSHGCLEKYASGSAIVSQIHEALTEGVDSVLCNKTGTQISAETVTEAARQNDKLAISVLTRASENIGHVLATVVSILAPEKIIIGGGLSKAGEFIIEPITRIIKTESVGEISQNLDIKCSELMEKAATLGSAQLAIMTFFENEIFWQKPLQ